MTYRNDYTVYAVMPSGAEYVVGCYEFRDQAAAAIERHLNQRPAATCYINDGTVGYVAPSRAETHDGKGNKGMFGRGR
jgi:hypothetical protein